MSLNNASLLSHWDLSGQSKNAGIANQCRKGCTDLGEGLPFPKVEPAMRRPWGTAEYKDLGLEGLSVCCRNGLPHQETAPECDGRGAEGPAPRQSRSASALIFVRRDAAIESLAFGTIGNSHSGILPQKRIKTADLGTRNHEGTSL